MNYIYKFMVGSILRAHCFLAKNLNRITSYLIVPLILIFAISCVDPLDIKTDRESRLLVVEGSISTLPGPYTVRLTESVKYGDVFEGFVEGLEMAEVSVRDNTGLVISFSELGDGVYETPAGFQGEVGNTYSLLVETRDGRCFLSAPDKITPVPQIDSLTYRPIKILSRNTVGQIIEKNTIEVFTHFTDPENAENYYFWDTYGTYQIDTNPELYVNPNPEVGPDPKSCCNQCWITEQNDTSFALERDANTNGSQISQVIIKIEDNGLYFQDKYLLRVEQHSITKKAYQFYSLLRNQLSISGNIFDPPPATIRGNMINIDNPDEEVIGFFRVSDVRIDSLFLLRDFLEIPQGNVFIPDDCRLVNENHTTTRPLYW